MKIEEAEGFETYSFSTYVWIFYSFRNSKKSQTGFKSSPEVKSFTSYPLAKYIREGSLFCGGGEI